jgi:hypothetical protein
MMKLRVLFATSVVILAAASLSIAPHTMAQAATEIAPHLLAQDINGFRLDMTVKQVASMSPNGLEPWGNDFRASVGGVNYDFGFTPLGHLYRIDANQELGRFVPDRAFGLKLTAKLTAKFGTPHSNMLPDGPASWGYLERYLTNDGVQLNRQTESLSAMLGGGFGEPVALIIKLIDFRILHRDYTILNSGPNADAQQHLKF